MMLAGVVSSASTSAEPASRVCYVSPAGNDAWSGRLADPSPDGSDGPWRTLARACADMGPGTTCRLRQGVYREVLRPLRDGAPGAPIAFEVQPGEEAVLDGADPVTGWEAGPGGFFKAHLALDLADQNQIFLGRDMLTEARWPDSRSLLQPVRAVAASGTANTLTDPQLPGPDDCWKGAVLWCAGGERWHCWSAVVTAFDAATHTLTFEKPQPEMWYTPRQGSEYVLMGVRAALDAEGEWFLDRDSRELWLKAPGGRHPDGLGIEAKRRLHVMDLSGRSYLRVSGLRFRAGGILTDARSSHLLFQGLKGEYLGHSYVNDISSSGTVLIRGHHIELNGCELAFASGSLLRVEGSDNRVINCFLHEGNYAGQWSGAVSLSGRRHLVSHNTIRGSGRDVCSIHGLMESLIQYNDLSDAGWLTADLGMTYGHNTDFMGTEIRYNWVHDNRARGHSSGIYFDHCSHNAVVHHNVVWNVPGMPVQINNPSYFMLVYHNTLLGGKKITSFDHSARQDLFGCRFQNNLLAREPDLPPQAVACPNLVAPDPLLVDPAQRRFGLRAESPARGVGAPLPGIAEGNAGKGPDMGACPAGIPEWRAGHDFDNPPHVDGRPTAQIPFANAIRNAAFELGTTEFWTVRGAGKAEIVPGNGWGNGFGRGPVEKTGTSKHELKLTGTVGVEQVIGNLRPGVTYQLSAWLKAPSPDAPITLGVAGHGGPAVTVQGASAGWERYTVDFTTGPGVTEVRVFLEQSQSGGVGFADNLGLPRHLER